MYLFVIIGLDKLIVVFPKLLFLKLKSSPLLTVDSVVISSITAGVSVI